MPRLVGFKRDGQFIPTGGKKPLTGLSHSVGQERLQKKRLVDERGRIKARQDWIQNRIAVSRVSPEQLDFLNQRIGGLYSSDWRNYESARQYRDFAPVRAERFDSPLNRFR